MPFFWNMIPSFFLLSPTFWFPNGFVNKKKTLPILKIWIFHYLKTPKSFVRIQSQISQFHKWLHLFNVVFWTKALRHYKEFSFLLLCWCKKKVTKMDGFRVNLQFNDRTRTSCRLLQCQNLKNTHHSLWRVKISSLIYFCSQACNKWFDF